MTWISARGRLSEIKSTTMSNYIPYVTQSIQFNSSISFDYSKPLCCHDNLPIQSERARVSDVADHRCSTYPPVWRLTLLPWSFPSSPLNANLQIKGSAKRIHGNVVRHGGLGKPDHAMMRSARFPIVRTQLQKRQRTAIHVIVVDCGVIQDRAESHVR
mmetsp:Transcript_20802/g.57832  ORF Transcript_20802/g.57832 Transcript_20802/m.57832 type:complete len:158 (-) Transcript_20802:841-1314(-)